MTPKSRKKLPGYWKIRSLLNWIWLKAAIPKLYTVAMCTTYAILMTGWVFAIVDPPGSLEGAIGVIIMYIISSMIVVGSLTGVFSAFWGVRKVEKWSVLLVGTGVVLYVSVVQGLHWTTEGNRLPQAQTITALLPTFIARFVWLTSKDQPDDSELLVNKQSS